MEERYLDPEIERLTELYEKDPTSRVFAPLADAYRKSKLYDEAIDILKKGLEIHPDYVSAHLVLARCYYEKDVLQLAKGSLEKVLGLDQQNVIALRLLGDILYRLGDEDGALTRYREVIEIDPTNLEVQALMEKIVPSRPQAVSPPIEPQPLQAPERKPEFSDLVETPETNQIPEEEQQSERKEAPEAMEKQETAESEEVEEPEERSFATLTLGEIYEEQGFLEKALQVYKQLLQNRPKDEQIISKVEELTVKLHPNFEEQIEKTGASFSGLLSKQEPKDEKEPNKKTQEEGEKSDFIAFKQWLEGLGKDEEIE